VDTPKRYRYSGKERDQENGFCYHGSRYFAPWLARWISSDAVFAPNRNNRFSYVGDRPIVLRDENGYAGTPPDFTEQEIDEALDRGFESKKGALKRKPLKSDVDEIDAVKGKKAGGISGSPTDPANKTIKDYTTNQQTKKNFVSDAPRQRMEPFEVPPADAPEAVRRKAGEKIILSEFDKPDELREFAKQVEEQQLDKTKRSNSKIRKGLREGKLPRTTASLEAAGMNPGTLTMENPSDVKQFPKGDVVQLTPADAPIDPKTGIVEKTKKLVAAVAENDTVRKIVESKAVKVVVVAAPILAHGAAKAAPGIGLVAGAADVANEASSGNTRKAALAACGMSEVPIVSQTCDLGSAAEDAGWAVKDVLDPEQKAEQWAHENLPSWLGF
jgi:RHS repeat-associated protein